MSKATEYMRRGREAVLAYIDGDEGLDCEHGHCGCANSERGPCWNELVAAAHDRGWCGPRGEEKNVMSNEDTSLALGGERWCGECGSQAVQVYMVGWIDCNVPLANQHLETVEDLHRASVYSETFWCDGCHQHVDELLDEDPEQTLKRMIRERWDEGDVIAFARRYGLDYERLYELVEEAGRRSD